MDWRPDRVLAARLLPLLPLSLLLPPLLPLSRLLPPLLPLSRLLSRLLPPRRSAVENASLFPSLWSRP
jgi:hypothetical protein